MAKLVNGRELRVWDDDAVLERYRIPEFRPLHPDDVKIYKRGRVTIKAFSTLSTPFEYYAYKKKVK